MQKVKNECLIIFIFIKFEHILSSHLNTHAHTHALSFSFSSLSSLDSIFSVESKSRLPMSKYLINSSKNLELSKLKFLYSNLRSDFQSNSPSYHTSPSKSFQSSSPRTKTSPSSELSKSLWYPKKRFRDDELFSDSSTGSTSPSRQRSSISGNSDDSAGISHPHKFTKWRKDEKSISKRYGIVTESKKKKQEIKIDISISLSFFFSFVFQSIFNVCTFLVLGGKRPNDVSWKEMESKKKMLSPSVTDIDTDEEEMSITTVKVDPR